MYTPACGAWRVGACEARTLEKAAGRRYPAHPVQLQAARVALEPLLLKSGNFYIHFQKQLEMQIWTVTEVKHAVEGEMKWTKEMDKIYFYPFDSFTDTLKKYKDLYQDFSIVLNWKEVLY